jgi:hypothetical protein
MDTKMHGPMLPAVPKAAPTVPGIPVSPSKVDVRKVSGIMPDSLVATHIEGAITAEEIWAIAKVNTEYYLDQAINGGCDRLWFQYPKFRHQYSEHVLIDEGMGKDLFKYAAPNRKMAEETVEMYRRDFEKNQWLRTHEGIGIDVLGRFFDGQQTVEGLMRAKKAWPLYVTWNCDAAAIMVVDSGRTRNTQQKMGLIMPDVKLAGKLASVCRSMMRGGVSTRTKWSIQELGEFVLAQKETLEWLNSQFDTSARADVQAAVAKAYLWYGPEKIRTFCQEYSNVEFTSGSPARALHIYMNKDKAKGDSAVTIYKKACNAVAKAANGEQCEKLYEGEDFFEWLPGWQVPSHRGN